MPRGRAKYKKPSVKPDPRYNNVVLEKFINHLMRDGKKTIAARVVYEALEKAGQIAKMQPMQVFAAALKNTSPLMEVKTRRVGGAHYQVPVQVAGERRKFLAMRWLIEAASSHKGEPMAEALAKELAQAAKGEGLAIKKKEQVHRMAEANKAFAYLAW